MITDAANQAQKSAKCVHVLITNSNKTERVTDKKANFLRNSIFDTKISRCIQSILPYIILHIYTIHTHET